MMDRYPKVDSVVPLDGKRLLVAFSNRVQKIYDCTPLLTDEAFCALSSDWFFKRVGPDPGGYGVSWGDEVDLSESELWINGTPTQTVS